MKLHRLTEEGLQRLESAIEEMKAAPTGDLPTELLRGERLATRLDVSIEPERFQSRFAFAAHIDDLMTTESIRPLQRDTGLWGWLTVLYFDQVCPRNEGGRRKIGALPRYVPRFDSWRHYYRHLLAGPWFIYAAHREAPERTMALLAGPLDSPGDVVEQWASRQEIVTCPGVMEAITRLYFNRSTGRLRRGVASKGAGSARRIPTVLQQFDLTWDLFSMTGSEVLEMLPDEFGRFTSRESGAAAVPENSDPDSGA